MSRTEAKGAEKIPMIPTIHPDGVGWLCNYASVTDLVSIDFENPRDVLPSIYVCAGWNYTS